MIRVIEIDGKKIACAEMTFGAVRKMTRMGVDFDHLGSDTLNLVNAYLRVSTGMSEDAVDLLVQKHIIGGGSLEAILEAFGKAMEESDFFQALAKTDKTATE